MKKVLTLEEFEQILEGEYQINQNEYDQDFITNIVYESFEVKDEFDKEINETFNLYIAEGILSNFIGYAKNPITGIKLVNNAKKLAKAQITNSIAKIDFEKKKQAAAKKKENDPEKAADAAKAIEIAQTAYNTKKEVAKDQISAIEDRMGELSKEDSKLSKISALLKTKARIEANKKLLTMLDAEERKQLQLTIKDQELKAGEAENQMADYIKDEKAKNSKDAPEEQGDPNKEAIEKLNSKIKAAGEKYKQASEGDDVKAKTDTELALAQLKLEKGKLENNKNAIQFAQDSIERIKMRSGEAKATDKTAQKTDKIGQEIADLQQKKENLAAKVADQKEGVKISNTLYSDVLTKRDSIRDKESSEYKKAAEDYSRISSERQADQARLAGLESQLGGITNKISELQAKRK